MSECDASEGLFPPDSVIRTVTADGAAVLLPAGRAILLQLAHPAVARGVADHSDFSSRPVERLRSSLAYIYGTVLGTRSEAERIGHAVRGIHRRINGPGYNALDPELQVWVAATILDSQLDAYQRVWGPLSPQQLDEAHRDYAVLATMLGCPEHRWPQTPAAFREYWRHMIATLTVTEEARQLATQVLHPAQISLRPVTAAQRLLTAGLLPPRMREQFGLTWTPRHERAFTTILAGLARTYPHLGTPIRHLPSRIVLRTMRQRMRPASASR
ncbi:oxygenase MpaB family protein [Lipingzhangella sp. LS1_29]|uniref:Oxygenase MpaB family protein n=1 Tax=Lipingzhangella rawalii TaxID=2055835 RepID=A0ABU2H7A9_9ACTN|nr:oxygenase MpaB family protein [Lipingzhangella rawalii]MDS1271196.1 oxygenase MpaB family protein [Lipingzhangella rawalii]